MPSEREDILDVAVRVAGCLERLQVRYALVGRLASSLQGDPRSTNDVDFVSTLEVAQIPELVRALGDGAHRRTDHRRGDVRIGGGVATLRQFAQAGLVDEMHLGVAPVLLGKGENLFAGMDWSALGFSCSERVQGERATHLVFRSAAAHQPALTVADPSRPSGASAEWTLRAICLARRSRMGPGRAAAP